MVCQPDFGPDKITALATAEMRGGKFPWVSASRLPSVFCPPGSGGKRCLNPCVNRAPKPADTAPFNQSNMLVSKYGQNVTLAEPCRSTSTNATSDVKRPTYPCRTALIWPAPATTSISLIAGKMTGVIHTGQFSMKLSKIAESIVWIAAGGDWTVGDS